MWTSIFQKKDQDKVSTQRIKFLSDKLRWIGYLIIQTKHSKLANEYGLSDVKDIVRVLENLGDVISDDIEGEIRKSENHIECRW